MNTTTDADCNSLCELAVKPAANSTDESNCRNLLPHLKDRDPPSPIRDLPAWLMWKFELTPGKAKPDKVPYYANGNKRNGTQGSPADIKQLVAFSEARKAAIRMGYDGVGFATLEQWGICAVDLDNVIRDDGKVDAEVEPLLVQTYAEISPSGKGLRLLFSGNLGNAKDNATTAAYGLELFSTRGYVTFTGDVHIFCALIGEPDIIAEPSAELLHLVNTRFPKKVEKPPANPERDPIPIATLQRALDALPSDLDYDTWLRTGMAVHTETAGSAQGFDVWNAWSSQSAKDSGRRYNYERWRSFGKRTSGDKVTGGTLIYLANKYGAGISLTTTCDYAEFPIEPVTSVGDIAPITEDACALIFSQVHPYWRYTPAFGKWHFYDPSIALWLLDDRLRHMTAVRDIVRASGQKKLMRHSSVSGIASLARSNLGVSMGAGEWDADPWMLGVPGGVIDLKTGERAPSPMNHYVTRQTAVAPQVIPTPVWDAFLERITRHDPSLVGYLQRIAGYALTGSDREQCLFFAHGPGGNGKGVFMNTLTAIMADYAHVASGDLLLAAQNDRHPTDMASLRGRRFVTASELRPGARWDEQRLKSLTGGDPITARFMRQDEFTFTAQFTLVISGNHRPSFAGVDDSIRRRLRLIPFTQQIGPDERDLLLPEKLRSEYPGILEWMLAGCLVWQRDGLSTPASVHEASQGYLEAEDMLGQWIADRVVDEIGSRTQRSWLFEDWVRWNQSETGARWSQKAFYTALEERGLRQVKSDGIRHFENVRLKPREVDFS